MTQTTYMAKAGEVTSEWYIVDARGQTLGRLAVNVARVLRGKHRPQYTPHQNTGDHVIVINAADIVVTGGKRRLKEYDRYSGYPGGRRLRTFEQAIGLDRARNYTFSGQSAWPPAGSMLDSLLWMAKMLAVPFAADEMTDEELDAARLDTQQFLGLFANMELPMRKLFGRWGPGFTFIGHLAKWMLSSPGNQAMAVLLFHRLRTEPAFQPGMEELRPTANEWTGHRRFWESLEQMSRDIPALGRVVTYPRLRAAMRSEAGQRQLAQVIHEVRTDHGDEIDRYIADHPELTFPRQDESAAVSSDDPEGVDGGTL